LTLDAFLVILWVVILDEVVELVDVCAVAGASVCSIVNHFLVVVRKDSRKIGTLVGPVFIAMASLETLEFRLWPMVSPRMQMASALKQTHLGLGFPFPLWIGFADEV
jgi:hypothetical protein